MWMEKEKRRKYDSELDLYLHLVETRMCYYLLIFPLELEERVIR